MKKAILVYLGTATAALAHPGHGETAGHWLTRGDHIIGFAILAVGGGFLISRIRNRE